MLEGRAYKICRGRSHCFFTGLDAKREEEKLKSDTHLEVVRESAAVWEERKLADINRSPNTAAEILNDGEENGYYKW